MNRSIAILFLYLVCSAAFAQQFSYSVRGDIFRTVFKQDKNSIINRDGAFNYSTSFVVSYSRPSIKYNLGIGISTLNFFYEFDLDVISLEDPVFGSFETRIKTKGNRFIMVPMGIEYSINQIIYLPAALTVHLETGSSEEQYKKLFCAFSTGLGFYWSVGEKVSILFEPTVALFPYSTPESAPFPDVPPFRNDILFDLNDKELLLSYGLGITFRFNN